MAVDFESFMEWASDRFGPENIKVKSSDHGTEICTHSVFAHRKGIEDHKFHLWMNPSGGKSKHPERGSYRCWKTDMMGSLVNLVADIDNISYEEAEDLICGISSLRALEERVNKFFEQKDTIEELVGEEAVVDSLSLPEYTMEIDRMNETHPMRLRAVNYLSARKIPTTGLFVCVAGDYKNRIIIPYYGKQGQLIWYNGRLMSDKKDALRYMKCKAEGLSQDNVLYMTDWPVEGSKLHIMEGEFDALSLKQCGASACAVGGKSMSDTQMEMIRKYKPVLAFDADDSGYGAMLGIGRSLLERGFSDIGYIRPPVAFKDWNKLLSSKGPEVVRWYLDKYEKPFTSSTADLLLSNKI